MIRRALALSAIAFVVTLAGLAPAAEVTFVYSAPGAQEVFLAGSFNGWRSDGIRLQDTGGGIWSAVVTLDPGTYEYKFVVDGAWRHDPGNALTKPDGYGGQNSVLEVPAGASALVAGGGEAPAAAPKVAAPGAPSAPAAAGGGVTFRYDAGGKVGSIYLAGEFNGWNATGDRMTDPDGDGVYTVTVDLDPGKYQYKFVVDGNWKADPAAGETADDGFGGQNSVITVNAGGTATATPAVAPPAPATAAAGSSTARVTFTYTPVISGVQDVFLAGSFNGWSDSALRMTDPENDGTYTVVVDLPPGEHTYKFVVDGDWQQDPVNPLGQDDGFGGQNSVVRVKHGAAEVNAAEQSAATAPATGTRVVPFRYAAGKSAKNVFLAGTFNDWNDSAQRMADDDGDGVFETTLLLQPGTYQYKFVADGNWKQDPANPAGTDDGFGGQNSVLEVDDRFTGVDIALGDGRIFTDSLEPIFDYSTCNPLSFTEIELTARAHLNDVQAVDLVHRTDGGEWVVTPMAPAQRDPAMQYYRTRVDLPSPDSTLEYVIRYTDADAVAWLGPEGPSESEPVVSFTYHRDTHPPFLTPDWAKEGVIYQIFPERFRNGDKGNDPDFSEPMYAGATELPPSGRTNGEYFHLVEDWYDVAGLSKSPYRTDGRPDYYSFYGGDIAGIHEKLDYLVDLGITVIYFNPLNKGMSNHKYDPVDYNTIDPHFATEDEFKAFVQDAHAHGIRIVVDMAFNHTGNWHFAFRDAVEKGEASEYWDWYEFKRWPLPAGRDFDASSYYDCWWGFGLHPNLNFDLSRPNAAENTIADRSRAEVNEPLVDYVLSVADKWLIEYDIDGFRLDVPNEVPFWFWQEFNERCKSLKPDCWLVGEIWGNAGSWIGPHCFDATMNYKYFRDPVMEYLGTGRIDAATFDQRLAPGRFVYPPQSVQVMMNLIDSHDTVRFLTTAGDVRRLMLAAMFSMNYVGMPHIWYGDEIGMEGGKDPDCRRPFDWRYEGDPRRVTLRDYYGTITRYRRDNPAVLAHGDFVTLAAEGPLYAFARSADEGDVVVALNAGPRAVTFEMPAGAVTAGRYEVIAGPDWFPGTEAEELKTGSAMELGKQAVTLTVPALSGVMMGR
jgi:cyclomaltodextrinase / maltogenic alpha-amylase / neopullulanase